MGCENSFRLQRLDNVWPVCTYFVPRYIPYFRTKHLLYYSPPLLRSTELTSTVVCVMHRAIVFFFREPHTLPIMEMLKERPATSYMYQDNSSNSTVYFLRNRISSMPSLFSTLVLNIAAHPGNIWSRFTRRVFNLLLAYHNTTLTAYPPELHDPPGNRLGEKRREGGAGFGRSLLGSPFSWTLVGCKRP